MVGTHEVVKANFYIVMKFLMYTHLHVLFMALGCFVLGVALLGFFIYHLLMIKSGMTTNESIKVSNFKSHFEGLMTKLDIDQTKIQDEPSSSEH